MTYASVLVDIDCCETCIARERVVIMRFRGIQAIYCYPWYCPKNRYEKFEQPFVTASYAS